MSVACCSQRPSCEVQASTLLDLVEKFPDLFDSEVLRRVDPADRAFFAQVSHGCRVVVLASELPCAGMRVGMRQLNPADRAQLAGAVRAFDDSGLWDSKLWLLGPLGYVASSTRVHVRYSPGLGQGGRMPVGQVDLRPHGSEREHGGAAVGA